MTEPVRVVICDDHGIVRSVDDVAVGEVLSVRVGDGTLHVRVERVDHDGGP